VTDWDSQKRLFEAGHKFGGQIDFVAANAGIAESCDILADDLQKPFLKTIDVNYTGVLYSCKLGAFYFRRNANPGGSLILTSSGAGFTAVDGLPIYVGTKHAVFGLMRALSVAPELAGANVATSLVAPGLTATKILSPSNKDPKDAGIEQEQVYQVADELGIPMQSPLEPAKTIAWLAAKGMGANGMAISTAEGLSVDVERGGP
jgi:NAD(P)-dependent dehydrogenase (short-subunit alcohol dehydrogenase family)